MGEGLSGHKATRAAVDSVAFDIGYSAILALKQFRGFAQVGKLPFSWWPVLVVLCAVF